MADERGRAAVALIGSIRANALRGVAYYITGKLDSRGCYTCPIIEGKCGSRFDGFTYSVDIA
jgi:hypothetical protein